VLYLIHFAKPLHHARHYLGYSTDENSLPVRLERHASGQGAKLMAAVARAGIGFQVVRTWPDGTRADERRLKNQKNAPARLCPVCREGVRRAA
jgi:hypothetical protein